MPSLGSTVVAALHLAAIPCVAMLVMSALVYVVHVPKVMMSAFQHLAAGIVLSAVAVELVPIINEAPADLANVVGIVSGFAAGVALFLVLAKLFPEGDDDGAGAADDRRSSALLPEGRKSGGGRTSLGSKIAFAEKSISARKAPAFPVAFTVAVLVDSGVDGLLIGLSSAAGASAGFVMAVALTIEMGFLALTLAAVMRRQPLCSAALVLLGAPAALAAGAGVGAAVAAAVASSPALHTALVSFGIAALLYLVTEELLLEAHEGQEEEHVWYVDLCFFLGFMSAFLLEKLS